jgi:hypothetical protein
MHARVTEDNELDPLDVFLDLGTLVSEARVPGLGENLLNISVNKSQTKLKIKLAFSSSKIFKAAPHCLEIRTKLKIRF